jgi:hypothetical protein
LIKQVEILAHGASTGGEAMPVGMLCTGDRPLLVGVRGDQAGIHRKSLAANKPFLDTAADHGLENMSEHIAVTKAAMTVLEKVE